MAAPTPSPVSAQKMDGADTLVTQHVCREDELHDGEMREVEVAGCPVLLVREGLDLRALGGRCPHAGAPLCKGYLVKGRLRCPWHGACFSTKTGDIEEYPTLDCLSVFQATVKEGQVYVSARLKDLESGRRVKPMARECQLDHQTALLLGAGPAALTCAETLRQEGFTGRIIMATWENHLPYDKTKLTQDLGAPAESLYLRSQSFLDAHNIEVWKQREVVSVDPAGKMAHFRDGTSQAYSSLLIATGCSPRKLQCPGCSLGNVCTLLTPEDANWILAWALGKTVVIVGASFIGMEVAGNLVGKAAQVQVVEKEERPYQLTLGGQVGTVAMKMLEAQGVLFHLKTDVAQMQGENGKVTNVILSNGSVLPADLVVVGIGNTPNTSFVQGSSIKLDRTGSILVDLFMKTSAPSVFAAGDVASFPVALAGGKSTPIYHWQIAQAHGRVAALNMLSRQRPLHTVPFFWTKLQSKTIRYAGYGTGHTETVPEGDLGQESFLLFYLRDGWVTAVASLNCDPLVAVVAETLYSGRRISKQEAETMMEAKELPKREPPQ
ncbi:apoptosis-inducing factor 3-like isoform X3 [Crotalus tigris]|uniref:apoptosis-inducing factor 3-like isoform X3 n=1 Tax=Crotalus tigris TaxID=88082 RepID=UPI00192F4EDD|nr:apoptosis-inducing factor 3-like isoform X3 [Crotalus tigris]